MLKFNRKRALPWLVACVVLTIGVVAISHNRRAAPSESPTSYYVDSTGSFQRQLLQAADVQQDSADAQQLRRMATMPWATWWSNKIDLHTEIHRLLVGAHHAGQPALVVIYRIPGRDCGLYSAGGAGQSEAYLAEIRDFAGLVSLTNQPVTVVLEPDAVAQWLDPRHSECAENNPDRLRLLRQAAEVLTANSRTTVLLDGGNSGWLESAAVMPALHEAGLDLAHGVVVNVSSTRDTEESIEYGLALVGGDSSKRVLVDTGRNGRGPYTDGDPAWSWCNPPGRALGPHPGTSSGYPNVEFAWVKLQGQSDGPGRNGTDPPAGVFMSEYALGLARNAGW